MQTIVIGHRNPDMDSICSAIAYANLKSALGHPNVIAGRPGNTNQRIDFVLNKFGIEAPEFFSDISPRVMEVMQNRIICVEPTYKPHTFNPQRLRRAIRPRSIPPSPF